MFLGCQPKMDNSQDFIKEDKTDWIYHVDSLLMPFWMSDDALGNPPGNYPAYRYPDGSPIDPDNLDYNVIVPEYQQFYMEDNFYSEDYNLFWGRLNKKEMGGHTDFAHSIKTFWMIHVTAKLTDDKALANFAREGAKKLLKTAFIEEKGSWASKFLDESLELDRSAFAWHNTELDQMAATLSFEDTSLYSKYLQHTYPYFEKYMIDHNNKGTYWARSEDEVVIEVGFRSGWHMANFHDLEHALIGYLSTANYYGDDIELYFAFKQKINPEKEIVQPYHYNAEIEEIIKSEFKNPLLSNLTKTKVTFDRIN